MPLGLPMIRELLALRQRFNDLVDEAVAGDVDVGGLSSGSFCPAADLYEANDALVFVVEVPGVVPGSVELQLSGDRLRVAGEIERSPRAGEFVQMERPSGGFYRDFRLTGATPVGPPVATLERGVLTVTVPTRSDGRHQRAGSAEEDA